MIEKTKDEMGNNYPIRELFQRLTERGMGQLKLHDAETIDYITNLLLDFIQTENLYRIQDHPGLGVQYVFDMFAQANTPIPATLRREYYKHLGDVTLFNLGLFPESLTYGRRTLSPNYYAEAGRRSYTIVAEIDSAGAETMVYRKLSEQFEKCVSGLNWVKLYINDPFYQYMLREFDITG